MAAIDAHNRYQNLLLTVGRAGASALFPKDFEVYLTALELVDADGNSLQYFLFPINPTSVDENQNQATNIKKTHGGVTTLSTNTFVPFPITIQGSFGRKFKILAGKLDLKVDIPFLIERVSGGIIKTGGGREGKLLEADFDIRVKTGFGCCKILENMINQARQVTEKGPNQLYFYNLSFGNSYLVRPNIVRFSQDLGSNMIWNYTLQLTTLAPLEQIQRITRAPGRVKQMSIQFIQSSLTKVFNDVVGTLI